jgi:malonyl-CoA O-methyltransferase
MLRVAAEKAGLRGRVAAGDASCLPIAAACADGVLCTLTLGHVRDPGAAMREMGRLLRRGGALLLTDFHPAAAAQGWKRTFRHGTQVYELENYPYAVNGLQQACRDLVMEECVDGFLGEPERRLFVEAGRPELFEAACSVPAVLLTRWTRV